MDDCNQQKQKAKAYSSTHFLTVTPLDTGKMKRQHRFQMYKSLKRVDVHDSNQPTAKAPPMTINNCSLLTDTAKAFSLSHSGVH